MTASTRIRIGLALLAAVGLATTLAADDRNLLRSGQRNPYVFIILDSSGSMNWSPPCTAAEFAAGLCNFLCPTGDCPVPRDGDDPASKMRQAKDALYEVVSEIENVEFGFATYNQDELRAQFKTWLYQVDATQAAGFVTLNDGLSTQFPAAGSQEVFGSDIRLRPQRWWSRRQRRRRDRLLRQQQPCGGPHRRLGDDQGPAPEQARRRRRHDSSSTTSVPTVRSIESRR